MVIFRRSKENVDFVWHYCYFLLRKERKGLKYFSSDHLGLRSIGKDLFDAICKAGNADYPIVVIEKIVIKEPGVLRITYAERRDSDDTNDIDIPFVGKRIYYFK